MKKILVPIDGSEYSERALTKAKEMAEAFDSEVTLLNVTSVGSIDFTRYARVDEILNWQEMNEEANKRSENLLKEAKNNFGDNSNKVETVSLNVRTENIAKAISDYTEEHNPDIIIMGSNGIGSFAKRLYLGSVTNKVLHLVSVPVLVVQ